MLTIPEDQIEPFRAAVQAARGNRQAIAAVGNVYQALQDAIDLQKPICSASGRCCRFEEYGHRLFVTTIELGAFLTQLRQQTSPTDPKSALEILAGCPFQLDGLCSVHTIRPFGCRVFFCDPTATDWQKEQYERFHKELKRLHGNLEIPYFYVEWRAALRVLNL